MAYHSKIGGAKEMEEILAQLEQVPERIVQRTLSSLAREVGEQAKELAPEDPAPRDKREHYVRLKSSMKVRRLKRGYMIRFTSRHAAVQHERTDYQHTRGQAKYLERPLMSMRASLLQRIAQHLPGEIAREAKLARRRELRARRNDAPA